MISVDVKQHRTMLTQWSRLVPDMSADIRGHQATQQQLLWQNAWPLHCTVLTMATLFTLSFRYFDGTLPPHHTPGVAFRHLPPRKGVVNQRPEFATAYLRCSMSSYSPSRSLSSLALLLINFYLFHESARKVLVHDPFNSRLHLLFGIHFH